MYVTIVHNFRGDVTDISAVAKSLFGEYSVCVWMTLIQRWLYSSPSSCMIGCLCVAFGTVLLVSGCTFIERNTPVVPHSIAVLADMPVMSPRKLIINVIRKNIFWVKLSQ